MASDRTKTGTIEPIVVFFVDSTGLPLISLTDVFVRLRRNSDGQFLDWNDLTFKAAGHTTINQILTEIDPTNAAGLYQVTGGLDTSAIVSPVSNDEYMIIPLQTPGTNARIPAPESIKIGQLADDASTSAENSKRLLGLLHQNAIIDNQTYSNGLLTFARLRIFDTAANVPATPGGSETTGLLFEYSFTATYDGNDLQDMFFAKLVI